MAAVVSIGPDAARYLYAARGQTVPRPFHLRWLLPATCGDSFTAWRWVRLASWPLIVAGFIGWQHNVGMSWQAAAIGAVLLVSLPGIRGPEAVIPVGVDLPATAVSLLACWLLTGTHPAQVVAGLLLVGLGATIRETVPVWVALWVWSPLPLLLLIVPLVRHLTATTGPDPLGPKFDQIAAHPIRSSMEAHRGRWLDGWLMLAPWGVVLLALHSPPLPLIAALVLAYGQLVVATDTVRLVHHAAAPPAAAAAAALIPIEWALLVCLLHVAWCRTQERV